MANGSQNMTTWKARVLAGKGIAEESIIIGQKVATSAPSALTSIDRITIIPYYHTGGPWCIKSMDDSESAFLGLYYGSTELMKLKHNGEFTVNNNIMANNGYLKSTKNGNTVTIGSANSSWCHIENSANIPFYFNKAIHVNGDIYYYNTKVHVGSSGFYPPKNGGIYWDPYVESSSDASDVTSIY